MERERGREIVGEGSSMSSREQRNLREQERRMRMKHLFNILSSYVSPTHRVLTSASTYRTSDIIHDSIEREVSIPGIQPYKMNLTMDLNMKRVMLYQLLNVFEEEGAQVMNANLQKLNDRVIILYNHSPGMHDHVVVTKSMVQPESHQTVQTGHIGGTSDRGSVQGVYLYNQKDFQHETNFIGFYTQEGVQPN
ncbi:hypothetical protein DY000_02054651 [Brassica cretica]|uniref:BHLH domain-containing protein n=1 Tax=Brassica cretica TaxID=69181 RepID=A0ABQ7AC99_BRACR|nr:hypothetical protein DY000_02054651 [Brassica cretica]